MSYVCVVYNLSTGFGVVKKSKSDQGKSLPILDDESFALKEIVKEWWKKIELGDNGKVVVCVA